MMQFLCLHVLPVSLKTLYLASISNRWLYCVE